MVTFNLNFCIGLFVDEAKKKMLENGNATLHNGDEIIEMSFVPVIYTLITNDAYFL